MSLGKRQATPSWFFFSNWKYFTCKDWNILGSDKLNTVSSPLCARAAAGNTFLISQWGRWRNCSFPFANRSLWHFQPGGILPGLLCLGTVASVSQLAMGCRSHPLRKRKINASSVVVIWAWVQKRKAKELPSSSSEKATVELLKAVPAAPGLHWPLFQDTAWTMQLFCPTAAAPASSWWLPPHIPRGGLGS